MVARYVAICKMYELIVLSLSQEFIKFHGRHNLFEINISNYSV